MKSKTFKIKKITCVYEYGFYASLPALLRGCLCVCMVAFLISCATMPQQTYLNNQSLSGISKVAVVASANVPEVWYSSSEKSVWPALLGSALGMALEEGIRSGIDNEHAAKIKEHIDISHIEDKMAQSFIQPLKKGNYFQTIECLTDKNQGDHQLSVAGYDTVIRLSVHKISIRRVSGDYVSLSAHVRGQMEKLMSGEIVWDREEVVTNPEPQTLDYYKENGLKELDAMLEKAGKNLAYDFIYLK